MRRLEDALAQPVPSCSGRRFTTHSPRDTGPWPLYLPLVITGTRHARVPVNDVNSLSRKSAVEPYVLDHTTLIKYLIRRGAMTDYFDHPLIAVRPGYHVVPFDDKAAAIMSDAYELQLAKHYGDLAEVHEVVMVARPDSPLVDLRVDASLSDGEQSNKTKKRKRSNKKAVKQVKKGEGKEDASNADPSKASSPKLDQDAPASTASLFRAALTGGSVLHNAQEMLDIDHRDLPPLQELIKELEQMPATEHGELNGSDGVNEDDNPATGKINGKDFPRVSYGETDFYREGNSNRHYDTKSLPESKARPEGIDSIEAAKQLSLDWLDRKVKFSIEPPEELVKNRDKVAKMLGNDLVTFSKFFIKLVACLESGTTNTRSNHYCNDSKAGAEVASGSEG